MIADPRNLCGRICLKMKDVYFVVHYALLLHVMFTRLYIFEYKFKNMLVL